MSSFEGPPSLPLDQARFDEVAARLADPEQAFTTALHQELASATVYIRHLDTGEIENHSFDEPDVLRTSSVIQTLETNVDPDGKLDPYGHYPVRRLVYNATALERTLDELDKPLGQFNRHVTHSP